MNTYLVILVTDAGREVKGTGFSADPDGILHVFDYDNRVAMFAAGKWLSIETLAN